MHKQTKFPLFILRFLCYAHQRYAAREHQRQHQILKEHEEQSGPQVNLMRSSSNPFTNSVRLTREDGFTMLDLMPDNFLDELDAKVTII